MEYGAGMEDGNDARETKGLGFNLCVVPLPKNKGVLNLDKQGRQRWVQRSIETEYGIWK